MHAKLWTMKSNQTKMKNPWVTVVSVPFYTVKHYLSKPVSCKLCKFIQTVRDSAKVKATINGPAF